MARAPRSRAKSTAARASARLTPRLRKPARVNKQVTAQTLASALSSARPSHGTRKLRQARVGGARLDRAPADGLAVDVRDQAAGRVRLRVAAVGLLAQPVGALLDGKRAKGLARPQLVALALAPGAAARAEDRLQVRAARLVGGHDADRGSRCRHARAQPLGDFGHDQRGDLLRGLQVGQIARPGRLR